MLYAKNSRNAADVDMGTVANVSDLQPEAVNQEGKQCTLLVVGHHKKLNVGQKTMSCSKMFFSTYMSVKEKNIKFNMTLSQAFVTCHLYCIRKPKNTAMQIHKSQPPMMYFDTCMIFENAISSKLY